MSQTSSTLGRVAAITRRDAVIEFSYRFVLVSRAIGFVFTVGTLYYVAKLVPNDRLPGEIGYFEFALIGLLLGNATSLGLSNFTETISVEQSTGSLEVLLATPTPLPTLLTGALMVPLGLTALEMFGMMVIAVGALGADIDASGAMTALLALPLVILVFCAFGIFSAAVVVLTKRGDPFTLLFTRVSTFLAGAIFPVAVMPEPLQIVAKLLPAYYALNLFRGGLLLGHSPKEEASSFVILTLFAVVLLPLAFMALSRALRMARVTGTLGSY